MRLLSVSRLAILCNMANLIPPDAKKEIVSEYWFRVVVVWAYLIGIGLLIGALLKAPALWSIESELKAYSGAYDSAQEKAETVKTSQETIAAANAIAQLLAESASTTASTEILAVLDTIAGNEITISQLGLQKDTHSITEMRVQGLANTRTALANFRNDIEQHPLFEKAELPISNLAKESDITFNITITPSGQ